jgi:hypothetical protein
MNQFWRENSKRLTSVQIYNITQKVIDECGNIIKDNSKSGELLQYLNSADNVIYIARFNIRSKDDNGAVIQQLTQVKIPKHDTAYDAPDRFSELCIQDLLKMHPNEMSRIVPPMDSKKNSSHIYELNAITWVTLDTLDIANRYPEVIMTDATCKTNSSNRPLIFVCGIDSLHKTVCISTTLTSNESKDTFAFILKNIRLIYGREWCSRVAVILSDGASVLIMK